MNQLELERAITTAHSKGDTAALEKLQDEYRSTAAVVRITNEPVYVSERGASLRSDPGRKVTSAIADSVPLVVRLTSEARRELDEVRFDNSYEHGGYLLGHLADGEMVITRVAGGNGSDTQGETHSVSMDREYGLLLESLSVSGCAGSGTATRAPRHMRS
jgi:hypothetical protein